MSNALERYSRGQVAQYLLETHGIIAEVFWYHRNAGCIPVGTRQGKWYYYTKKEVEQILKYFEGRKKHDKISKRKSDV
jgi:hypothetical protein